MIQRGLLPSALLVRAAVCFLTIVIVVCRLRLLTEGEAQRVVGDDLPEDRAHVDLEAVLLG